MDAKFKVGDEVFVTGYDSQGRDGQDGFIIRYEGTVARVHSVDAGSGEVYSYTILGGPYPTSPRSEESCHATKNDALEHCAEWWERESESALRKAARIRERKEPEERPEAIVTRDREDRPDPATCTRCGGTGLVRGPRFAGVEDIAVPCECRG